MLKKVIAGFVLAFFAAVASATAASAACTVTNTFMNGQTADATQVNTNFSNVLACINALAEVDGTWNPSDASGAGLSFTTATAFYHKVGKIVLVWGYVQYPTTSSSLQATIGNLPFTASNTSINGFPSITMSSGVSSGPTFGFVAKNGTTFGFGANSAAVTNATMSTNNVYFSGVYPTDS